MNENVKEIPSVDESVKSFLANEERDATIKRGRGRPRNANASGREQAAKKVSEEINDLFSPQNFRALVRVPADIKFAVTGRAHWELTDAEVDSLAITSSTTAKYFASTAPKYLALTMLLVNFAVIYGGRVIQDARIDREKNKEKS